MGKKIKPSSLLDNVQNDSGAVLPTSNDKNANNQDLDVFVNASLVGNPRITNEDKAKLEKYDALEKTILDLSREKEVLEAKIAEYAEQLEKLNAAADTIKKLENEITSLKEKLEKASNKQSSESALLLENKALREEVDSYLVKISELTFENANLTCQLDELSKNMSMAGKTSNQAKFSPNNTPPIQGKLRHPNVDAYNPYMNNGYKSW